MKRRSPHRGARSAEPVEQAIEAALQPDTFIEYEAAWSFIEGLDRVEEQIAKLVGSAPARAVALYEAFLAGCYEKAEEIDDSGDHLGMFIAGLFRGWVTARQAADAEPDETARRLLAWMDTDAYGFSSRIERDLMQVLDRRGLAALERCLRARLEGQVTAGAGPGDSAHEAAYVRRRAAAILRAILAAQGNVEAYVALCEATELATEDCLAIARMLQARRQPADALAWVERGRALDTQHPLALAHSGLTEIERELLVTLGRGDAARDTAWADFQAHPSPHTYAELMRYVPEAERAMWHERAMVAAAGAELSSALGLWLETQEIDRLVARLRRASDAELEGISHFATEPVAEKLASTHPAVAAKVYRALGMRILAAGKSKYYDAALAHFAQARRCYERAGLGATWERLVREVRARHHRKFGFMPGFEQVVAGGGLRARATSLARAPARRPRSRGR